jgi:hypothetical protein
MFPVLDKNRQKHTKNSPKKANKKAKTGNIINFVPEKATPKPAKR